MWRLFILAALLGASACSTLSTSQQARSLSEQDIAREGEAFVLLDELEQQLTRGEPVAEEKIQTIETQLTAIDNPLALADFYWLTAMNDFMVMRVDNNDSETLQRIDDRLKRAKALYASLQEPWLQAKSTLLLAMAHARASRYKEVCDYYDETMALLDAGPGRIADFVYDKQAFAQPQDYVDGMFGDTCRVLRHDPGRHNFDEHGQLKILQRRPS